MNSYKTEDAQYQCPTCKQQDTLLGVEDLGDTKYLEDMPALEWCNECGTIIWEHREIKVPGWAE